MRHFFQKVSHFAEIKLGKESLFYKSGAAIYRVSSEALIKFGLPQHYFLSDANVFNKIITESSQSKPNTESKHIVFFTIRSWTKHVVFESLIAARLRYEGHRVTFISCAESLSFCMNTSINQPSQIRNCQQCITSKNAIWNNQFNIHYLPKSEDIHDSIGDKVKSLDLDACRRFEYKDAAYGRLVEKGIIWFFRRSQLIDNDVETYRNAIISAHTVRRGLEDYFSNNHVDCFVMINGDFSAEKVASWVCHQRGIRFVTHDYTINDLVAVGVNNSVWDDLTFNQQTHNLSKTISAKEKTQAERILKKWRKQGGYQGGLFWTKKDLIIKNDLRKQLDLDNRPLAVAYTNMTFESSVIGKDKIFKNQFHWLNSLIDFFIENPDFQLAIRIHPAEVRNSHWRPNESIYNFLIKSYQSFPNNIKIIGPSESISSYELAMIANVALVYSSTIAMELADRKKHVITTTHVHYAKHGFTIDPSSEREYFYELNKHLSTYSELSASERNCLVNYIAWLFLKRLINFEAITSCEDNWPKINISNLKDLISQNQKGLKKIIDLLVENKNWWE